MKLAIVLVENFGFLIFDYQWAEECPSLVCCFNFDQLLNSCYCFLFLKILKKEIMDTRDARDSIMILAVNINIFPQ